MTLTKLGADQIGLEDRGRCENRSLPYAAMLYDADGQPYVFVNVKGLTFHREDITIKRVSPAAR